MSTQTPGIVLAVLAGDLTQVNHCLATGESPNQLWGRLPLVAHAALFPSYPVFRSLMDHGAKVPKDFLQEVISWELGDYRIDSLEKENEFCKILSAIRPTEAWLSAAERSELVGRLRGYNMPKIIKTLLGDDSSHLE